MRFTKLITLAAMTAASTSLAGAQMTTAGVKPVQFGVSAGAAIPVGDLSNGSTGVNTGYTVGGHVQFNFPESPLGIRGDVGYTSFGAKGGSSGDNLHDWNATANAIFSVPAGMTASPYLLGGVGAYGFGSSANTGNGTSVTYSDKTRLGFQLGGGLNIPLGTLNTFVEAKYVQVNLDGGSAKYVPITFGIMF